MGRLYFEPPIGPHLFQVLGQSPFVNPLTLQRCQSVVGDEITASQLYGLFPVGMVGVSHLSQGSPWELLYPVHLGIDLLMQLRVPLDHFTVLLAMEIASFNESITAAVDPQAVREVAAEHFVTIQKINTRLHKRGKEKGVNIVFDSALSALPSWRRIEHHVQNTHPILTKYAARQTTEMGIISASLPQDAVMIKIGTTTVETNQDLIRRGGGKSLHRSRRTVEKPRSEAEFDQLLSTHLPLRLRSKIASAHILPPVGPDHLHPTGHFYIAGAKSVLLRRDSDPNRALGELLPDLGVENSLADLEWRCHQLDDYFRMTEVIDRVSQVFKHEHDKPRDLEGFATMRRTLRGQPGDSLKSRRRGEETLKREILPEYYRLLREPVKRRIKILSDVFGSTQDERRHALKRVPALRWERSDS